MESKEDVSDSDSGIMLHSGPDSPVSPLKDLTQAVRKQQQELAARLEACLAELRKLCLREAELTGMLPQEYPLKQGDRPPKVRRRIGTAFRLDEKTIISRGADPLSTLERDLALQLQIAAATHRLYREENISKHIKKRRKNMVLKEEKKLKELENALNECRLTATQEPRASTTALGELSTSDDSSLSDAILLEEEEIQAPNHCAAQQLMVPIQPGTPQSSPALPARSAPSQQREGLPPTQGEVPELERSPIQNSPWKETSLDRPYEKPRKHSAESCSLPSPAGTPVPVPARSPAAQRIAETPPYHFVPIQTLALWRQAGSSGPPTPEMQARRGQSQSMRVDVSRDRAEPRGRSVLPRRRPTYYTVTVPNYCFPPSKPGLASHSIYHSSSEDSNSDVSSVTYAPSPGSSSPDISFLRPVPPPSMEQPSPVLRGPRSAGPEAAYYYQTPQKRLLPPSYFPAVEYVAGRELCRGYPSLRAGSPSPFPYEQDLVQLRCHWLGPAPSRLMRTPSLKDYAPGSGRALAKSAVSEELKSWHERTKLRNLRPHSLDRQGAFRVRNTPGRELYASRSAGQQAQVGLAPGTGRRVRARAGGAAVPGKCWGREPLHSSPRSTLYGLGH
ncbi:innate immunity activator protein isoform X2 [Mauremys reevesii]|uniref:innate immunity activator protein isoform X2 n=1 Tax=Mauremys reevesii TaxID=260615 RepID=UPI00193F8185|nr:innate immunity activator protein isoform X2 [Mauremys reevesii]